MNILFISISSLPHVSEHGISLDLIHEFKRNGHNVFIISALEKRDGRDTFIADEDGCKILRVKIGNNKRANIIEKGLTTLFAPQKYISAIKKYYSDIKFDLILYPTPPITQVKTVKYIKKRDGAKSYLLLKDIFPQNAIDIGLLNKTGVRGLIYKYFRLIEKQLYATSDFIGCMSEANVDYLIKNNQKLDPERIEVCPNSIEIYDKSIDMNTKLSVREKYDIPNDKRVFIYGGNLGKPQGIDFVINCLRASRSIESAFFVIVGDGTEYEKLEQYVNSEKQSNLKLIRRLPKDDYDVLVAACDVGLIFLDYKFTIPNFPSRLLGYMQAKIPVLAVTDPNTDIGKVIVSGNFGWWCKSNSIADFVSIVNDSHDDLIEKGKNAFDYLNEHYSVKDSYKTIVNHIM